LVLVESAAMSIASAPQRLRLPDGRFLGVRQIGDPHGIPVLYCHGAPSSSAEWRLFGTAEQIAAHGVRLIAPDRPGSGASSFQVGRRILHWSADAGSIMDRLGIGEFALLGYSGGGPYALACALRMQERLTAVVTVSGTGPFDAPGAVEGIAPDTWRFMQLSRSRPLVSRAVSWVMGVIARFAPDRMAAQARTSLPAADAAVLEQPDMARAFARLVYETTHGSPQGAQHDTALMVGPWGFEPAEVQQHVRIWHGTEDRNAPPAMARYLAESLPSAELAWLDGEGHLSAAANHGGAILDDLVQRVRTARG
jgi:pimeloyl-ACP methyl ester carboxylesterase